MSSKFGKGKVIRVSSKGQATVPRELRERFGIETTGKVLIHGEAGKFEATLRRLEARRRNHRQLVR